MRALLFPGQGSQRVGMGRDLAHEHAVARRVFEEADDSLGYAISKICFDGPEDTLTLTENTQPAILANSVAVLRVLEAERGLTFEACAGHSLGEWTALVAAGALRLSDALRLVHLRGKAMQEAVPEGLGAMAALIGMELDGARALCEEAAAGQVCEPANLNGGGQIVISGHAEAIDRAVAAAKGKGARRAIRLQVSAPFHCSLMAPAAEKLAAALEGVEIAALSVPVVANVDARPNRDPARVKTLLIDQVTGAVRWEESVRALCDLGADRAVELGSGAVLRGLIQRIAPELEVITVGEPHEIQLVEV
jgi:[acyl-carrier-protein] S-malonyltransferase